jgi:VWFA-related protein
MVRNFPRVATAVLAATLGGAVLGAQSASEQSTPQGQPTFRARVDLVTSDVIVRDGNGQFTSDLKKEEFEIYEDGVKQDIVSMVLVHGGRTFNVTAPPPAPTAEGIILPAKRPTNDAAGRIFIVFVDDLHLDFRNTGRIRELFKKIGKTLIHEGDMFGIVSTGPSSISIDLTYDLKRFDEAVKKIAGNGLKPSDIMDAPQGAEGNSEIRYRAHTAFSTAYDILKKLEAVHNRRKAFIYVSNGYDFDPFSQSRLKYGAFSQQSMGSDNPDDPSYTDPFTRQGNQFAAADLVRELAELTRAANRANATFYTIDPRGLVGGPDLDENVDPTEWNDYVRVSQDSLRVIAEQTGGIAVVNQNDFDKAHKRIDAETSDYYVLGFYSSNPDPLKRTRKIEVKVKRPDLSVWSRPQYSLRPNPAVRGSK